VGLDERKKKTSHYQEVKIKINSKLPRYYAGEYGAERHAMDLAVFKRLLQLSCPSSSEE